MRILSDDAYQNLLKGAHESRRSVITNLRRENNLLADKLEAEKHKHEHEKRELEAASQKQADELTVLNAMKTDAATIIKRRADVEARETVVAAKESAMKTVAAELAESHAKAEEAREEGYKKGYADGVADGIREATKITAEDRKMMMQVAALAASSHTPEAATEIAKTVLKEVTNALPAGTATKK